MTKLAEKQQLIDIIAGKEKIYSQMKIGRAHV